MNMLHKSSQDVVAICTHEGSNGAAGEHKTWKCVFPCKNCGGTEAGPRRDSRKVAIFIIKTVSKTNSTDFTNLRRDRGGTEAGPQSAIKTVAGPRRDPLTPFGLLKL